MNKLTILIIRSYLGPLILTFFISLFVLVMQFLWKYIDQLVGKGLEWSIILELLFYASATLVPMALPLAILLSSIMTMGAMAENLELVAAKAAGISLLRVIRPLIILSIGISFAAFLFANYGMPMANYKLKTLLSSIQRTRPAIDIPENAFYDGIKGVEIFVEQKGEDEKSFKEVMIYDHSNETFGAASVAMADSGSIGISDDENTMVLQLFNGQRIDDRNFFTKEKEGLPLYREEFSEQKIYYDVSEAKFDRNNENVMRSQYSMMTVNQLNQVEQELKHEYEQSMELYAQSMKVYLAVSKPSNEDIDKSIELIDPQLMSFTQNVDTSIRKIQSVTFENQQFLKAYLPSEKTLIKTNALQSVNDVRLKFEEAKGMHKSKLSQLAKNRVEFHRKFSLSIACIILFFIGAPLGAIIRKGGLGLPLILCIIIFIFYYVISTIGEKSVKNLAMLPEEGMWLSTIILFPVGLFLTLKASSDSPLFVGETYMNYFKKIIGK